jgi:polyhydroxyalkanoate synthase
MAASEAIDESWWPRWGTWVDRFGGEQVAARVPGDGGLTVLEPAPGRYAKLRVA